MIWLWVLLASLAASALFAVAAVIARRYEQRPRVVKRDSLDCQSGDRRPLPASQTSVLPLSRHGEQMLAKIERKRQSIYDTELLEELSVEEAKIRSGLEGEHLLDAFLKSRLDDKWVIVSGYRAHKGEIDRILIGPGGIYAFEVKHLSGIVSCHGDLWWRDLTDRRGRVVKQGVPIEDNAGRSPSEQINDAVNALERLLKKNGYQVSIVRGVVLTHPRAVIGRLDRITVDFCFTLATLPLDSLLRVGTPLTPEQVRKIATSIRRHHEWFERKTRENLERRFNRVTRIARA